MKINFNDLEFNMRLLGNIFDLVKVIVDLNIVVIVENWKNIDKCV